MSVQNLANAPLIDTDLPTADPYYTKTIAVYSGGGIAGGLQGLVDTNRPYINGSSNCSVVAMDNVPNSFGLDVSQKGIIAVFNSQNYDGSSTLRLAIRKPTATLKDYTTGWDILPEVSLNIRSSGDVLFFGWAGVASQRQGQYAYVFMQFERSGIFTDTLYTQVYKVTRDEYAEQAGISGGGQVIDGDSTVSTDPLIQAQGAGQFFVSDEEQPFIWNVYGGTQGGGTTTITGFRDDNSQNIGYSMNRGNSSPIQMFGQAAAFLQEVTLPKGVYGYGPYLVHPWASGSYDPPELWYFIHEFDSLGNVTGRFNIYRARWKKGKYIKPTSMVFGDDPDFLAGRTNYPALNPLGYAFETDIFHETHKVGVLGPFQGINVYNPAETTVAGRVQNTLNTDTGAGIYPAGHPLVGGLGFTVVRDKKRLDTLHVVIADGGVYPTNASTLNRIWFANTANDGATWSRLGFIAPSIVPANQGTAATSGSGPSVLKASRTGIPTRDGFIKNEYVGYFDWNAVGKISAPPVVRTHDDVLLMGNITRYTNYSFGDGSSPPLYQMPGDYGSRISMAVIDYTGLGAASSARDNVFYVQKVQAGQIAWQ